MKMPTKCEICGSFSSRTHKRTLLDEAMNKFIEIRTDKSCYLFLSRHLMHLSPPELKIYDREKRKAGQASDKPGGGKPKIPKESLEKPPKKPNFCDENRKHLFPDFPEDTLEAFKERGGTSLYRKDLCRYCRLLKFQQQIDEQRRQNRAGKLL